MSAVIFRLCLLAGLCAPALSLASEPPVILVLGDSLSAAYGLPTEQGWVALLAQRLSGHGLPHQVINASVSGETTGGGLTRFPALLARYHPRVVIVQLGANDGLRGLGFDQIGSNLTRLIRLSQEADARVLLIGLRLPPNYGAAYTEGFQAIFPAVAEQTGVPLAPRLLAGVAEDWGLMQPDGLHPTAEAQPRMLENVWPHLLPLLEATREPGGA
ncbi:MAG: arylesterase [Chromatiaceae bacterium]|nr:arylesterase [Chromatiaceae bacterium]